MQSARAHFSFPLKKKSIKYFSLCIGTNYLKFSSLLKQRGETRRNCDAIIAVCSSMAPELGETRTTIVAVTVRMAYIR